MSKSRRSRHPVFIEIPKAETLKLPVLFISYNRRQDHPVEILSNIPFDEDIIEERLWADGPNRSLRFFMKGGANLFVTISKKSTLDDAVQYLMSFEGASKYKVFLT